MSVDTHGEVTVNSGVSQEPHSHWGQARHMRLGNRIFTASMDHHGDWDCYVWEPSATNTLTPAAFLQDFLVFCTVVTSVPRNESAAAAVSLLNLTTLAPEVQHNVLSYIPGPR